MVFYEMDPSGSRAYRYGVSDDSFLGYDRTLCSTCGREIVRPRFNGLHHKIRLEGGKRYPDLLAFCGAGTTEQGERYLLLSERAVEAFSREGITGLEDCQQATILTAEGASHDVADAPNYYLADISGTIDLNGPAMSNLRKKNMCPACGKFRWSHQRLSPLRVDSASWNGKDLCRLTSIPGCVICTEKVREMVKKHRLTNFAFTELPDEGGQET